MLSINDNVARASVRLWLQVSQFQQPPDALLSKFFRENRSLTSHERSTIAETIYAILRHYYKLTRVIEAHNSFSLIGYTWLKLFNVARQEIRQLKSINLGELDRLAELDHTIVELPAWVIERLLPYHSREVISDFALAMTRTAPLTLRVNLLKGNRANLLQALTDHGILAKATRYSPYGLKLGNKAALMRNQLFNDGWFEVQDESSQLAGLLLAPKRGEMIVDFCAGSGGKALLFGMLMKNGGRIYAFDVNERRLANLTPRLARSGLSNIYPQLINDERDVKVKRLAGKIDRVFVDAPCLGFGTLRRNPDLKLRHQESSLAEIVVKQQQILASAAKLLKIGGRLVYATCSILHEENQNIIENFLATTPGFRCVPAVDVLHELKVEVAAGQFLELSPSEHGGDGFFAAVVERIS